MSEREQKQQSMGAWTTEQKLEITRQVENFLPKIPGQPAPMWILLANDGNHTNMVGATCCDKCAAMVLTEGVLHIAQGGTDRFKLPTEGLDTPPPTITE